MKTRIALACLFLLSIGGALLEGLWTGIPTALIQLNGLLLLLSSLCLVTLGARSLFGNVRTAADAGGRTAA